MLVAFVTGVLAVSWGVSGKLCIVVHLAAEVHEAPCLYSSTSFFSTIQGNFRIFWLFQWLATNPHASTSTAIAQYTPGNYLMRIGRAFAPGRRQPSGNQQVKSAMLAADQNKVSMKCTFLKANT